MLNHKEIIIVFESVKNKGDSIQYVPIFETLILQHEDVLGELTSDCESEHANLEIFKTFKNGICLKETYFQSNPNALQICLYHGDFNIVNPLGNMTEKYKISVFFVSKYGYKTILGPLLHVIKKLETVGV